MRLEDVVLLLGKPRFNIAGNSCRHRGRIKAGHRRVYGCRVVLTLVLIVWVLCMLCILRVLPVGMRVRLRQVMVAARVQLGGVMGSVWIVGGSDESHDPATA